MLVVPGHQSTLTIPFLAGLRKLFCLRQAHFPSTPAARAPPVALSNHEAGGASRENSKKINETLFPTRFPVLCGAVVPGRTGR